MDDAIQALKLDEAEGKVTAALTEVTADEMRAQLPDGSVTVAVSNSTVNYKDGMVVKGLGKLVRTYPHVPGIDLAGTIEESDDPAFKAGDEVIVTGWHVGERCWGGYAQKARMKADWLVPITPDLKAAGLTPARAMAVGTAGFTAMLCILALEEHGVTPDRGPVLVSGAAGGVGSVAVAILSKLGYEVAAATGRAETHAYLKDLGATQIVERSALSEGSGKPLDRETWAGMVDTVGSTTLATALSQMKYNGAVAACGLAGGPKLETTVVPFLLRGVSLLGIDSVMQPMPRRLQVWERIAADLDMGKLDAMTEHAKLEDLPALADAILAGKVRGRMVIDLA